VLQLCGKHGGSQASRIHALRTDASMIGEIGNVGDAS
jgi:hypothetical protein